MLLVACSGNGDEVAQLESDLAAATARNVELTADVASVQQKLADSERELTQAQDEANQASSDLASLEAEIASLRDGTSELRSTLEENQREAEQALAASQAQVEALLLTYAPGDLRRQGPVESGS